MNLFSRTFHWVSFEWAKKQTRGSKFLREMEGIIPWEKFLKRIDKHYYDENITIGRKKYDSSLMLKIYFLQQWFNLSDPAAEDAIYDRLSFQQFLGIDIARKYSVPDETSILKFRHFLEEHNLQERFFEMIVKMMQKEWYILTEGTSVDASLIKAPSSTKNKENKRDPEMSSTKKNGSFHFGAKLHIGSDHKTGLVHHMKLTKASIADTSEFESMLWWNERAVFWDKGYRSKKRKQECRAEWMYYWICDQRTRNKKLSTKQIQNNIKKTSVRKKIEFNFWIPKVLWWHTKVRYKWIRKNEQQFYGIFALVNLYKYKQILKRESVVF